MRAPSRRGRLATVLVLLLTSLTVVGVSAPGAGATPGPLAEPYTTAASVTVNRSSPCRHTPVTLTGVGYVPGSTEVLTIGSTVIGRPVADSRGTFTITVTLPESLVGAKTITVVGPSGLSLATTQIDIRDCGNGATDPGGATASGGAPAAGGAGVDAGTLHTDGGANSGLSTTGVAVFGLLGVGVLMLVAGGVLVLGGRRRRTAPSAS